MSCAPRAENTPKSKEFKEAIMNNQTIETLKRIQAKRTLELPLTDYEKAMWTLYGEAYEKTEAAAK